MHNDNLAMKSDGKAAALADDRLQEAAMRFEAWVRDEALPFWAGSGCDLDAGGFHERIAADGSPLDEPRRARVVARQIYVFATALRSGWSDVAAERLDHGLDFLLGRMKLENGIYAASVRPDASVVDATFDLYEQAFVLFAMGAAFRADPTRADLPSAGSSLLRRLREGWQHELGGFHAGQPPVMPLQSNPHMHLFEAALEWSEIGRNARPAGADGGTALSTLTADADLLADELAELCLQRFIDPATAAVHEYFDLDWRPMPGQPGRIVEPGHQFEWAWLLTRWGLWRGRADAIEVAKRLVAIGEEEGVDALRGIAINQLQAEPLRDREAVQRRDASHDALNVAAHAAAGFEIADATAKLWPQTERIKAWCAMSDLAAADLAADLEARGIDADPSARLAHADDRIVASVDGLLRYMQGAPRGRWHEQWYADGSFSQEPTRASSLYHIVCAAETLGMSMARRRRRPV
ncbi:MAG: ce [Rhizobacter sp.]|nr:ce [Rhizobacter sp.]